MTGTLHRLWYNSKSRGIILQIIAVMAVLLVIFTLIYNLLANYAIQNKSFGFDFLLQPAGYDISESMSLIEFASTDTHLRAAVVGLLGTLNVGVWGIITTTILGLLIGVARLSPNFLINRIAYVYVETIRNVPLLLQILFWAGVFVNVLPSPRESLVISDMIFLNNSGVNIPKPIFEDGSEWAGYGFLLAVVLSILYHRYAQRKMVATGQRSPVLWVNLAMIIGFPLAILVILGFPISMELPTMGRFRLTGGWGIPTAFIALWFSLSTYTASFIAEIVRAGILSVSYGQSEAALALGLKRGWVMRLILIPQALRVIVPPLCSQYLNLVKNSSLAIAVGYVDITLTLGGSTLNITGHEMECMMIVMAFYLTISLSISALMNMYNKKIAIRER